jgi:hypothetical protein
MERRGMYRTIGIAVVAFLAGMAAGYWLCLMETFAHGVNADAKQRAERIEAGGLPQRFEVPATHPGDASH